MSLKLAGGLFSVASSKTQAVAVLLMGLLEFLSTLDSVCAEPISISLPTLALSGTLHPPREERALPESNESPGESCPKLASEIDPWKYLRQGP